MNAELIPFLESSPVSEVVKRLTRVNTKVDHLLEIDERCRNDDKWLIYQYLIATTGADVDFNMFSWFHLNSVMQKILYYSGVCHKILQDKI